MRGLVVVLSVLALAGESQAQETQRCTLYGDRQTTITSPTGQKNAFFGGNVRVHCPAKSLTLTADSLEGYEAEGRIFFIGDVHYDEPRLSLTSNYLTYYQRDERVVANGNVNARLPSGSTLAGPVAEYYRIIPGTRPATRLVATGRPTITIAQKDSAGNPVQSTTVLANNVTMLGDSLVYAGGAVVVTREEVIARGDSVALDSEREVTVMMREPSIEGRRDRPFTLSGDRIELLGRNRKLDRVLALGRGKAVSEDMTLTSDTIDLRIVGDLLERVMAWGPSRARVVSRSQQIVADSIDVHMPGQRVLETRAVRLAAAEGRPDSTRFRADTVDWMRGDTIIARFDTATARDARPTTPDTARAGARDTTRTAKLRQLVAVGNARSYYHLAPADSTLRKPAINYVRGREIVVDLQDQRVSKVTVIDQAAGVYLEPRAEAPPARATADSAAAPRPDSRQPAPAPTRPPPARRPMP